MVFVCSFVCMFVRSFGRACVCHTARIFLILPNYTTLTSLPHYTALRHYCNYYTTLPLLPYYIVLRPLLHYIASPPLAHYTDSPSLPHYSASLPLLHYQLSHNFVLPPPLNNLAETLSTAQSRLNTSYRTFTTHLRPLHTPAQTIFTTPDKQSRLTASYHTPRHITLHYTTQLHLISELHTWFPDFTF